MDIPFFNINIASLEQLPGITQTHFKWFEHILTGLENFSSLSHGEIAEHWESVCHSHEDKDRQFQTFQHRLRAYKYSRIQLDKLKNILDQQTEIYPERVNNLVASYVLFCGVDNQGIYYVLKQFKTVAHEFTYIRKLLLHDMKNAEANTLLQEKLATITCIQNALKVYSEKLAENIIIRLEGIAEHGICENPMLQQLMQYITEFQCDIKETQQFYTMHKSQFDDFFVFIIQSQSARAQVRLAHINWCFGRLFLRHDGKVAAYPRIFTDGELLTKKPWFSWFFPGWMLRYRLFEDGFQQVRLHDAIRNTNKIHAILMAQKARQKCNEAYIYLNLVTLLNNEIHRIECLESGVLTWCNGYTLSVSKKWKQHITGIKAQCVNNSMRFLAQWFTKEHDDYQAISPNILSIMTLVAHEYMHAASDVKLHLKFSIIDYFGQMIQHVIFGKHLEAVAIQRITWWLQGRPNALLRLFLPHDALVAMQTLCWYIQGHKKIGIDTALYQVLYLIEHDFLQDPGGEDSDRAFVVSIMQAIINKKSLSQDGFSEGDFVHIQQLLTSYNPAYKLRSPYITFEHTGKTHVLSLFTQDTTPAIPKNQLCIAISQYTQGYSDVFDMLKKQMASIQIPSLWFLDYMLDFADKPAVLAYAKKVVVQYKTDPNISFSHVKNDRYIIKIRAVYPDIADDMYAEIEAIFLQRFMDIFKHNNHESLENITRNYPVATPTFTSLSIELTWQEFRKDMFKQPWSEIGMHILQTFYCPQTYTAYMRYGLHTSINAHAPNAAFISMWLLSCKEDPFFWCNLGISEAATAALHTIFQQVFQRSNVHPDALTLLTTLFNDQRFVSGHCFHQLSLQWNTSFIVWKDLNIIQDYTRRFSDASHGSDVMFDAIAASTAWSVQKQEASYVVSFVPTIVITIWHSFSVLLNPNNHKYGNIITYEDLLTQLSTFPSMDAFSQKRCQFMLWLCKYYPHLSSASTIILEYKASDNLHMIWQDPILFYLYHINAFSDEIMRYLKQVSMHTTCAESDIISVWEKSVETGCIEDIPYIPLPKENGVERIDDHLYYFYKVAHEQYKELCFYPRYTEDYSDRLRKFKVAFNNFSILYQANSTAAAKKMSNFYKEVRARSVLLGFASAQNLSSNSGAFFQITRKKEEEKCPPQIKSLKQCIIT